VVDTVESIGVLGANRHQSSLYVSLDPAVKDVTVTLRANDAGPADGRGDVPATPGTQEPLLSLVESRWRLSERKLEPCSQSMLAQGYGAGEFVFEGRRNRAVRIKVAKGETVIQEEIRWTDGDGRLPLLLGSDAKSPLRLTFTCHD
jgi:hypothetical protein